MFFDASLSLFRSGDCKLACPSAALWAGAPTRAVRYQTRTASVLDGCEAQITPLAKHPALDVPARTAVTTHWSRRAIRSWSGSPPGATTGGRRQHFQRERVGRRER